MKAVEHQGPCGRLDGHINVYVLLRFAMLGWGIALHSGFSMTLSVIAKQAILLVHDTAVHFALDFLFILH